VRFPSHRIRIQVHSLAGQRFPSVGADSRLFVRWSGQAARRTRRRLGVRSIRAIPLAQQANGTGGKVRDHDVNRDLSSAAPPPRRRSSDRTSRSSMVSPRSTLEPNLRGVRRGAAAHVSVTGHNRSPTPPAIDDPKDCNTGANCHGEEVGAEEGCVRHGVGSGVLVAGLNEFPSVSLSVPPPVPQAHSPECRAHDRL